MESESGICIKELRVDGGATKNSFLMQFQADMLQVKVTRTEAAELSAMGSVYMAGIQKLRKVGGCRAKRAP